MTSDPKLPQCAAVDGCDSYGHPLRCESVATSQKTGLCDRHAAIDKPLPIPTYKVIVWPDDGDRVGSDIIKCDDGSGPWCDADDVRGLVERAVKAEAQRDRLVGAARAVTERGGHTYACTYQSAEPCVCGFAALRETLAAIDKGTP